MNNFTYTKPANRSSFLVALNGAIPKEGKASFLKWEVTIRRRNLSIIWRIFIVKKKISKGG